MLIRFQDGHGLINLDNIAEIYVVDNGSIMALLNYSGSQIRLASYETIEEALKVLDMIGDTYGGLYSPIVMGRITPDPVFQMPQDDEVRV